MQFNRDVESLTATVTQQWRGGCKTWNCCRKIDRDKDNKKKRERERGRKEEVFSGILLCAGKSYRSHCSTLHCKTKTSAEGKITLFRASSCFTSHYAVCIATGYSWRPGASKAGEKESLISSASRRLAVAQ